jgi:hypothetical protein
LLQLAERRLSAGGLCAKFGFRFLFSEGGSIFSCRRDRYPSLFAATTMQQFMWQDDIVGVAHFVRGSFDLINVPDDDEDASSNQP